MKISLATLILAGSLMAQQQSTLTDSKLMGLAQAGVSEAELLRMVSTAPKIDFDLRPESTDAMIKSGVSEEVIKAMAARETGQNVPISAEKNPSPSAERSTLASVSTAAASGVPALGVSAELPAAAIAPVPSVASAAVSKTDLRTRIFVGETSEWQASSFNVAHSAASYSAFSGSAAAGAFGMSHAGLMKLTVPVMNQISRHCPSVLIVNRPDIADLFVRLDQSTSMWARHDDMAVFNRAGEMIFVTSTHSISKDAKRFCANFTAR